MKESKSSRRRRFDALFESYSSDIVAYCGWRAVIRELTVACGAGASAWTYTVTYGSLGATPALAAPANARPLRDRMRAKPPTELTTRK